MAASSVQLPTRAWVFTWNNYTEDWKSVLEEIEVRGGYCVVGEEVAPETGTPHLQGYVYWPSDKSWAYMKAILPHAHLDKAKGNPMQNYKYCTKDGKFVEFGIEARPRSIGRTERKEKPNYWELVSSGCTERDLVACGAITTISQLRFVRELGGMVSRNRFRGRHGQENRERPIDFIWVTGPPGSGKSLWVYNQILDFGATPHIRYVGFPRWWNGIQDEGPSPTVWFDELYDLGEADLSKFLTMFDHGAIDVELKGGHATIRPKMVIVTSTTAPADLPLEWSRDRRTHLKAIVRRITDMYYVAPTFDAEGHIVHRNITRVDDPLAHYGFLRRHVEDSYGRVGARDGYPAGGWASRTDAFHPRSLRGGVHDRREDDDRPHRDEDRAPMGERRIDTVVNPRFFTNGRVIIHDELGRVSGATDADDESYSSADDFLEDEEP